MTTAESIRVDTDEGRFVLVIDTDEQYETLRIDIHDDVLEFYAQVRREIGPYAAEAENARQAVSRGVTREEYVSSSWDTGRAHMHPDEDAGYALNDPKHPTYHERMVD